MRAVAASALLPLAPALLAQEQPQQLAQLQSHLWNILLDSEELSPATGEGSLRIAVSRWHERHRAHELMQRIWG